MIPKKIHYIWLGKKEKSKLAMSCIASWYVLHPDYEIIEWNEDNLNLKELCASNKFLGECYKRKLWAFMADYIRLYLLYNYGGIYMDLDVSTIKKYDECLNKQVFIGYEYYTVAETTKLTEGTGIIGAEKHNLFIEKCLKYYDEEIWNTNVYYIPTIMTIIHKRHPEIPVEIYAVDYFAPYDYNKKFKIECLSKNTIAIHWFANSWSENKQIGLFLETKHIKNPIKKFLKKFRYILGYYKRKLLKR